MVKQEGPPLLVRALLLLEMIPQKYRKHAKAVAIVFVAIFCMAPGRILLSLWRLISTAFGVALGLGFGLGLAMHVFDHLQNMKRKFDAESASNKASTTTTRKYPSLNSSVNRQPPAITLEDSSSYVSLMTLAGYPIEDKVLRGQLLRENSPFWQSQYQFTDVPIDKQCAPNVMQQDWPSLPPQVAIELGRFVEHVMRDFIAMWYYKIDKGCEYRDEREKRAEGILRDGKGRKDQGESMSDHAESNKNSKAKRKMVFSTAIHRRMPMMDKTYSLLSAVFGNLATRFEHVNVFSLVLLKWTNVLAQTFKVYRTLRKTAQEKNRTDYPTEIQITREFLLAGKLHRALTFGLDVPSLLFADTSGHECGTGTDRPAEFPLQVLEERLMNTPMLEECQLDYNRVLAHRLVRALLPKADCNSPVAFTLVVEIFATYVLMPIMGLWIPAFLNGLIIMLMDKTSAQDQAKPDETRTTTSSSSVATTPTTPSPASEEATATSTIASKTNNVHDTKEQPDITTKESEIDSSMGQQHLQIEERRSRTLSTTSSEAEESIQKAFTRNDQSVKDPVGSLILNIVVAALDELQKYVNLSDGRKDHRLSHEDSADWDDPACQKAILRLVMVVEAVLLHGRCMTRETIVEKNSTNGSFDDMDEELTEMESEVSKLNEALPQLLMEMTSDMDLFESKIESLGSKRPHFVDENSAIDFEPSTDEVSTLRTLLSTWLHTGNLSRAIILIIRGFSSFFSPFYSNDAFLANPENAKAFCGLIEVLNGVDIMVDTMVVLSSSRMDLEIASSNLYPSTETAGEGKVTDDNAESSGDGQINRSAKKWSVVKSATGRVGFDETWSLDPLSQYGNMSTPRYLDFRKNSGFASSLREERERRIRSWETRKTSNLIHTVHRRGASAADVELHNEMHHLARIFHNGTNLITIRDAARKSTGNDEKVGLLTLETISNRRRIEVPDDDSSFLLKAQPRPLNAISVHRDDRNHDLSYKCFLATYEEPAINSTNQFNGGRYIRRCFLQYYPIDRTASVTLHNDARKLDRRKGKSSIQDSSFSQNRSIPYLSGPFLRDRHLCQKWIEKGSGTSFFSSTVMETNDFNSTPRSGKAIDFIYRLSLFERPSIDLAGRRFTVQDSSARGPHRADASALEVSDASLSALLLTIGRDYESREKKGKRDASFKNNVEMGPDGYPCIFMKTSKKHGDQVVTEMKPYRTSFVRAAAMITSSKQEAQLQCLSECVRSGSAKSATKARIEEYLRPTLKILDFANSTGDRSKVSILLRDLKLGVYHIDFEQLRRNGLLNPRSPTRILDLNAKVEDAVAARDLPYPIGGKFPPEAILYKIRCIALVEYISTQGVDEDRESYLDEDGHLAEKYLEEWVVYRSIRDFYKFHKHIKSEVASTESSASTGSRLVGAAFGTPGRRARKILVPSLSKTGGLAVTKKAIIKRGEILSEYLEDLLSPHNLINRSMELMLFLGASQPFPPEVKVMNTPTNYIDPLGRSNFLRTINLKSPEMHSFAASPEKVMASTPNHHEVKGSLSYMPGNDGTHTEGERGGSTPLEMTDLIPAIINKVDQVPLVEVRNRIVELVRYQFGFENASFFRSQVLSALETASIVAMTKASSFRDLLYQFHVQNLNPDAIAGLITKVLDLLWPDGVFMTGRDPYTEEEEKVLEEKSKEKLHGGFPEQITAILGQELTEDGLDMVHEMLQNRIVVKSLFYMLFDLLWIEIFPELRDALSCADPLSNKE